MDRYMKKQMSWIHEPGRSYQVLYLNISDKWIRYNQTSYVQPNEYGFGGWTTYQHLRRLGWYLVPPDLINPNLIQRELSVPSL